MSHGPTDTRLRIEVIEHNRLVGQEVRDCATALQVSLQTLRAESASPEMLVIVEEQEEALARLTRMVELIVDFTVRVAKPLTDGAAD